MTQNDQTHKTNTVQGFFARNILVIICALMAVAAIISASISVETADENVAESKAELEQVRQEATELEQEADENTVAVVKEVSGVDLERKSADDKVASELMGLATSWSTGKEYNENRASIIRRFKLDEGSAFMKTFMPDQRCRTTTDGTEICMIDADGLSSDFVKLTSSVIKVKGSNYTYFGVATISTPSSDGSVSISTQNPVIYTVDGQGTITEITPYAISGPDAGTQESSS